MIGTADMAEAEERLRELERASAVHEAVCAERYKGIDFKLRLLIGLMLALLGAAAAGNPFVSFLRGIFAQ